MKSVLRFKVIEIGRVVGSGTIDCEEEQESVRWDSILFDLRELASELDRKQWIELSGKEHIPESHRNQFMNAGF